MYSVSNVEDHIQSYFQHLKFCQIFSALYLKIVMTYLPFTCNKSTSRCCYLRTAFQPKRIKLSRRPQVRIADLFLIFTERRFAQLKRGTREKPVFLSHSNQIPMKSLPHGLGPGHCKYFIDFVWSTHVESSSAAFFRYRENVTQCTSENI